MPSAPQLPDGQKCEWYAGCDNDATTWLDGPIISDGKATFGLIPACDRCADRVDAIENALTRSGN